MLLRALILGAGYRGRAYAEYARVHPDALKIVGVADPEQAEVIPADRYWKDWRDCLKDRPEADIVFITLPDQLHQEAALAALEAGYHLLLEKPIALTAQGCRDVIDAAQARGKLIVVGHVLRHTPYFKTIKELIDSGDFGEVISISHQECVGYWKFAHSFVRGNWANAAKSSPIVLQKCSHDMDLFVWWLNGRKCEKVASFGSLSHFRPECAPVGSARRCVDCPASVERSCIWSALDHYLRRDSLHYLFADSSEAAMKKLVNETDYGACVYRADNDVADHQNVILEFEGGVTVAHTLTAFTEENTRKTLVTLTKGEIFGNGEYIRVTRFGGEGQLLSPNGARAENESRHDGGDFNLVADMIGILERGDKEEICRVTGESLASHLICFAAEESRLAGGEVRRVS